DKAPPGFPNPFKNEKLGAGVKFDVDLSEKRYELVNSLFDRIITFRLKELNAAWKAIHDTEKKGETAAGRQAEFEQKWDEAAVKNYTEAKSLAEKAAIAK